ncbi:hypothetical protein O6H91_Y150600 [Diphasiastrum complanatum]|nr:hypothetical protein O6H91_Y150600 [Diphasiastrum complanatum]
MSKDALTSEQLKEIREVFSMFDKDGDGSISEMEMAALFEYLGLTPDATEVRAVVQKADKNSNGLIEFCELLDLLAPEVSQQVNYNSQELLSLFQAFDRDGNGFITAVELAHSMARLGHPLSVRDLSDMISAADSDGDGRISYPEFVSALTKASVNNSAASFGVSA